MAGLRPQYLGAVCLGFLLSACQTTPQPTEGRSRPIVVQTEDGLTENTEDRVFAPQTETPDRSEPIYEERDRIVFDRSTIESSPDTNFEVTFSDYLPGWDDADFRATLISFSRNCSVWDKRDSDKVLMKTMPEFGQYKDWQILCAVMPSVPNDAETAKEFFESYFLPANLLSNDKLEGLLTGYYEPEIEVRSRIDGEFSEPILQRPEDDDLKNMSRADIYKNQIDYKVLAYGRPIDVFFMQVQGSGRLRFKDGEIQRAAYGGHNGHKYKSIGSVLIRRREMTRDEASKQSIENWMANAGSIASRELMEENERYIYFGLEEVDSDEGPKGSFTVPLTSMASMAIDPKARPYGVPVWLQTTLPQHSGDFVGSPQSLLVIAQDSGTAIKGKARGDLFFGSGDEAGELAGVMKHDVTMTHLLPRHLVLAELGVQK
ncbi:MAG: MltA domain-containing protein [Maricaulaceae bacterium]